MTQTNEVTSDIDLTVCTIVDELVVLLINEVSTSLGMIKDFTPTLMEIKHSSSRMDSISLSGIIITILSKR